MSRCSTRRPPGRRHIDRQLTVDHLVGALDVFDEQLGAEPAPAILRVRQLDAGGVELASLPVDDEHPLELLTGFDAPSDWSAIGVAASGTGHELDGDDAGGEPGRVLHLVARNGVWASRWRGQHVDGGTQRTDPGGRVDDACRRSLGLPTAPPHIGLVPLLAFVWLDAVLARATTRPALSWTEVALLHPVFAITDGVAVDGPPEVFADDVLASVDDAGWLGARAAAAAELWHPPGVACGCTAAWLDDGAFSRWVLGAIPEPRHLASSLTELMPPPVVEDIEAALSWWAVAP